MKEAPSAPSSGERIQDPRNVFVRPDGLIRRLQALHDFSLREAFDKTVDSVDRHLQEYVEGEYKYKPWGPEEDVEFNMLFTICDVINNVANERSRGAHKDFSADMVLTGATEEQKPYSWEIDELSANTSAQDVLQAFLDDLKKPGMLIGRRKLPGITIYGVGSEDVLTDHFQKTEELIRTASETAREILPGYSMDEEIQVFLLNSGAAYVTEAAKFHGYYNPIQNYSVIHYAHTDPDKPFGDYNKIKITHEHMHYEAEMHDVLKLVPMIDEGFAQVATEIALGRDVQRLHHGMTKEPDVRKAAEVIRFGAKKRNQRYENSETYAASGSLFTSIYTLGPDRLRKQFFGAFIKFICATGSLEASLQEVYGVSLQEFENKWKKDVVTFQEKHPYSVQMRDCVLDEKIYFGRKELGIPLEAQEVAPEKTVMMTDQEYDETYAERLEMAREVLDTYMQLFMLEKPDIDQKEEQERKNFFWDEVGSLIAGNFDWKVFPEDPYFIDEVLGYLNDIFHSALVLRKGDRSVEFPLDPQKKDVVSRFLPTDEMVANGDETRDIFKTPLSNVYFVQKGREEYYMVTARG